MLGGGRAVLLQLAHPYIAAGVDDHSNFQNEILERLYRTGFFLHNLVFSDSNQAMESLRHFHAIHKRIRGRLKHRAGNFNPETIYSGDDPYAKLWVHASFIDSALMVYEKFIRPLTRKERRSYYADSLVLARLLKIPEDLLPGSIEDFQHYMQGMLTGDTLAVTDCSRKLAEQVLYPRVGFFPSLSAGLLRFVTAGILPDRLRKEFGLKWGRRQEILLNRFSKSIRFLRPAAPSWVWQASMEKGNLTHFLLWGSFNRRH